ncbi:MAG: amidohydrolase, partial [Trueperaceae bacterium]
IKAIGNALDLRARLPAGGRVHDLAGATVLPGLGDAHVHMTATGFLERAIDGAEAEGVPELLARVRSAARDAPTGALVLGLRVTPDRYREERAPTREELNAASPDRPVYLRHVTGHASYANDAALALLDLHPGYTGVTLDPVTGAPTGHLIGPATQEATHQAYAAYSRQVGYESALRAAAARAVRRGCTTLHALDDLDAVRTLLAIEDDLPVRAFAYPQTFDLDAVRALGLTRIGGCHACALDGDVDMRTAAMLAPYAGHPTDYGSLYHNDETLRGFVLAAHHAGMQVAFHAVGDRAVEQALGVYEAAQASESRPNARHRIEHAQWMSDEQRARARAAGVVLSMQPAFNLEWPHASYEETVGPERAEQVDPVASALRAGLPLAGGSDSTVTELRPLAGVHAAVNHSRPEERVSVRDAVRLFSHGVAYAAHHDRVRGRIVEGLEADLTIVDRDPFTVPPHELASLRPLMTVVRGEIVHRT